MSKTATVAPPSESTDPNFAIPVIRYCLTGPCTAAPIVSPTSNLPDFALALSITISRELVAQRPPVSVIGFNFPIPGSSPNANVGLPLEPSGLPLRPISLPVSELSLRLKIWPVADCTSPRPLIFTSTERAPSGSRSARTTRPTCR